MSIWGDGVNYDNNAAIFKALGDPTRLKILNMLTDQELCACMILEEFDISQPTLSHHMKILCNTGLVRGIKKGKWTYYYLVQEKIKEFSFFFNEITLEK